MQRIPDRRETRKKARSFEKTKLHNYTTDFFHQCLNGFFVSDAQLDEKRSIILCASES